MKQLGFAILIALAAACGKPGEGEECDTPNSTDDCDDGLVCTNEASGNACRKLCDDAAVTCPTGTACNGISGGSHKSCQPDKP